MIITNKMLQEKVPKDMIPTRLDSATDIYTYTRKGLLLYNINPNTWNVLYPFFQQQNKFTIDSFNIEKEDITYQELINKYNQVYQEKYVEKGFNEERRKEVLLEEFNDTFQVTNTKISTKLDSHYELKYSKSKKVYTLYYLESYVLSHISDVNKLQSQQVYKQEYLNLESIPIPKKINGVELVDSLSLLNDNSKLNIIKNNIIE